jgi:hypothetical protein
MGTKKRKIREMFGRDVWLYVPTRENVFFKCADNARKLRNKISFANQSVFSYFNESTIIESNRGLR